MRRPLTSSESRAGAEARPGGWSTYVDAPNLSRPPVFGGGGGDALAVEPRCLSIAARLLGGVPTPPGAMGWSDAECLIDGVIAHQYTATVGCEARNGCWISEAHTSKAPRDLRRRGGACERRGSDVAVRPAASRVGLSCVEGLRVERGRGEARRAGQSIDSQISNTL